MAYFFSPIGNSQLVSTTGAPLAAGTITTFAAGTSTPQATYADNAGGTPATSLTLNTYGLPTSPVWLKGGLAYKFVVKDALGNTIRTVDNIVGIDDPASFGIAYPSDGTFSFRNRIHNGNFVINQRTVSGTVTLAANAYGHDRWKAGAGGCTYTFAAVGNSTVITITAGTLMQVVDSADVEGGVYSIVNQGSAQARYAVNSGSTSGGFFAATTAAPLQTTSATANQTITLEFSTGTLDRIQVEPGTNATPFERRPKGIELALCQRYFWRWATPRANGSLAVARVGSATTADFSASIGAPMRSTPVLAFSGNLVLNDGAASPAVTSVLSVDYNAAGGSVYAFLTASGGGLTVGRACVVGDGGSNTAALTLSADL